jgi:hypothetical protein
MKTLKVIGLFVGGFVLGGIAVNLWWGHLLSRMIVSKEVEVAAKTAFEAEWLALLRLGETKSAIESLEKSMDIDIVTIAQWAETSPPDEKMRIGRDRWLVPAKIYHESYPPQGDEAARVSALLVNIPGRSPQSVCQSGICRLDDLRRGVTVTNTPTK